MKFPRLTPRHIVTAARLALPVCLAGLAVAILWLDCSPPNAAAMMFLTAAVMLQSAPRTRASDMIGALALFVTLIEWGHASIAGNIDAIRWQSVIAVAGAMVLLLKVQHWRSLAREDPYVPLRHLERRNVLMSRGRPRTKPRDVLPDRRAA